MVTLRNAYFVGAAGRQQRSFPGLSVSSMLCIAQSMVMSPGRSSHGASDASGHGEKGFWERRADSLALSCVSSISGCCGTKRFV